MTASALFLIIIKNFYFQRFRETQHLFKMWHNEDTASALNFELLLNRYLEKLKIDVDADSALFKYSSANYVICHHFQKRRFLKTAETLLSSGSDLTGSDLTIKTELFVLKKS